MAKKKNTQANKVKEMEVIDAPVIETVEIEAEMEAAVNDIEEAVAPIIEEIVVEVVAEEVVMVEETVVETSKPYKHEIEPCPHKKEIENNTTKLLNRSFGYSWNGQELEW